MSAIVIPHATSAFLDRRLEVAQQVLIVVTNLSKESPTGPDADARDAMLTAIAQEVQARGLNAYEIRWSGGSALNSEPH